MQYTVIQLQHTTVGYCYYTNGKVDIVDKIRGENFYMAYYYIILYYTAYCYMLL